MSEHAVLAPNLKAWSCVGKVRFETWSKAERAATRKRHTVNRAPRQVYRCHHCRGFHVATRYVDDE